MSLRDVAGEAGVAYGLIHHHFGDKDSLVAAVIAESVEDFQTAMAGAETPVQMLTTFFENPDMALLVAQLSVRGTPPSWQSYPLVDATVALIETWEPDPQRARILAAGLLASAAGWVILGPFLCQAIDLDAIDPDRITGELAQALERLIQYPNG